MPSIALTGGGTAGHIMPNLALLPQLYRYFDKIIYIAGDGMERELVPKYGLKLHTTEVAKLSRTSFASNVKIPFALYNGVKEAKYVLETSHIDVVFAKGGYASVPTALAARSLKIPVVTHESDFSLGVANRFISTFASSVLTSFPETEGGKYVGSPVREEIFNGNAGRVRSALGLAPRPTVLVFGGSLGSQAINDALYGALPRLTEEFNVIHVIGRGNEESHPMPHYHSLKFADNIEDYYAVADVVVIRGGANSLAETTALGKRTLCIPLPKGASRGDQIDNAESYRKRKLISVLPQSDLTSDKLYYAIKASYAANPPKPQRNNANEAIVHEILKFL